MNKAGRSLIAMGKLLNKYQKEVIQVPKDELKVLKIRAVNKNCTELILDLVPAIAETIYHATLTGVVMNQLGIKEFGKQFFGTIGKQLALKLFEKGKKLKTASMSVKNGEVFVALKNHEGESINVLETDWLSYKKMHSQLAELVQLEKGKEEKIKVGYKEKNENIDVAEVSYESKKDFSELLDDEEGELMEEEFDIDDAEKIKIVGRFIDFHGLARKYHFSFQARKDVENFGRQKIHCMTEELDNSKILDLLKLENAKNVCVHGWATRNWEGKVDKMKIEFVCANERENPYQEGFNL